MRTGSKKLKRPVTGGDFFPIVFYCVCIVFVAIFSLRLFFDIFVFYVFIYFCYRFWEEIFYSVRVGGVSGFFFYVYIFTMCVNRLHIASGTNLSVRHEWQDLRAPSRVCLYG